jgi:alpha-mannosidase
MDNDLVGVVIAADGTFSVTGPDGTMVEGAGRIVDGGDRGDSYNYGPPANDVLVEDPLEVAVDVVEQGPLRAVIAVTRTYAWPESLGPDVDSRSGRTVPTPVTMLVELRRHEPMVRLNVQYVNQSKDHRVRLHVPLPGPVEGSASEGQFAVTERGLTGEGGWGEFPLPTFPAYGFASAGPATVLVRHATEYEAVDGRELAVTLSRSVGSISVNLHPLRDEPAASEIPIPGAQELGSPFEAELALLVDGGGWRGAGAVDAAEVFRSRPLVVRGRAAVEAVLPAAQEKLRLAGDDVVLSSLRLMGGELEARLVCMSGSPRSATLAGDFTEAAFTDLLGNKTAGQAADGFLKLELGPWEILTVRLK